MVHDLKAVWIWGALRTLNACGLLVLADKGYQGASGQILTPYKGRNKPQILKDANRAHARLRGPSERPVGILAHPAQAPPGLRHRS